MSTIDDQLSAYQRQGYNVLIPRTGIRKISAFHDTVLETVSLTIANGDVYPHDESDLAKAKKFRLSKLGLLKLSHAAGIVWRWSESRQRSSQGGSPNAGTTHLGGVFTGPIIARSG